MVGDRPESPSAAPTGAVRAEAEVVEVGLFLSAQAAAALEAMAHQLGLTVGQLVRRLIGDFVRRTAGAPDPGARNAPPTIFRFR
jgi:hypothetical protein